MSSDRIVLPQTNLPERTQSLHERLYHKQTLLSTPFGNKNVRSHLRKNAHLPELVTNFFSLFGLTSLTKVQKPQKFKRSLFYSVCGFRGVMRFRHPNVIQSSGSEGLCGIRVPKVIRSSGSEGLRAPERPAKAGFLVKTCKQRKRLIRIRQRKKHLRHPLSNPFFRRFPSGFPKQHQNKKEAIGFFLSLLFCFPCSTLPSFWFIRNFFNSFFDR